MVLGFLATAPAASDTEPEERVSLSQQRGAISKGLPGRWVCVWCVGVHQTTFNYFPRSTAPPSPSVPTIKHFVPRDLLRKISRPRVGKRPLRPHHKSHATPALLEGFLQPSTRSCFACREVQVAAWTRTGLAAVLGDRPFAFYFIDGVQNISPS